MPAFLVFKKLKETSEDFGVTPPDVLKDAPGTYEAFMQWKN